MYQLIAILIVAALFVKYFWALMLGVALIWIGSFCRKQWRAERARAAAAAEAEQARIDGLRERADQQQAWRLAGDPRGTYGGEFPAAPS
jgi:hypothetical protein